MSAAEIYNKYADKDGFISLDVLSKVGWTKARAEDEGLIIKENYRRREVN